MTLFLKILCQKKRRDRPSDAWHRWSLFRLIHGPAVGARIDKYQSFNGAESRLTRHLPFYSSPTVLQLVISFTTNAVLISVTFVSPAQSIHADYLSCSPGDSPWIIVQARPFPVANILLVFQKGTSNYVCIVIAGASGCCVMVAEECVEGLIESRIGPNFGCAGMSWSTLPLHLYTNPSIYSIFEWTSRWTWCSAL